MGLKIWCEACEGCGRTGLRDRCSVCKGAGYTDPPQEVLDAIECNEIKKQIKDIGIAIRIKILSFATRVDLGTDSEIIKEFFADNELEALRKAKEWLNQKGGGE